MGEEYTRGNAKLPATPLGAFKATGDPKGGVGCRILSDSGCKAWERVRSVHSGEGGESEADDDEGEEEEEEEEEEAEGDDEA